MNEAALAFIQASEMTTAPTPVWPLAAGSTAPGRTPIGAENMRGQQPANGLVIAGAGHDREQHVPLRVAGGSGRDAARTVR